MKNRILRSALSVALCAAMLLSQGLTAFAEGEIDLAAAKSSPVQESSEESEAKTPAETLTPETKKELPASTEDETKTETTTGQPTAEDDTAKETTAKTPAVVSEEEKSEEATAAPAEAQAATNSYNWGGSHGDKPDCDDKWWDDCDTSDLDKVIKKEVFVSINCETNDDHSKNYDLKNGDYTLSGPNWKGEYTVNINAESIVGKAYSSDKHQIKCCFPKELTATKKWTGSIIFGHYEWKLSSKEITIVVECEPEISAPTADEIDWSNLKYEIVCKNEIKEIAEYHSLEASALSAEYISNIQPNEEHPEQATATIDVNEIFESYNSKFPGHTLQSETTATVELEYLDGDWVVDASSSLITINVSCDAVPSITRDEIVEVLGNATVNVVCTIDGNHIPFKITADSIRVGEWDKNDNSVPFYLLTESYVGEFNSTYPGHTLKNSNDKEIEFWIFYGEDGWTVNFTSLDVEVVCSGTPVEPTDTPEPPSMEKVMELLWDKKVTANCINDDYKKKETYDIQYETIGGLLNPTIKPIEGENGSYSLKLTIAYDPYKDDFEDKYGPHDFADNQTSTSEFYLKWDGLKWSLKDPDSFPGSFNVICDTPSTESLWGWNNGKEVIITCVEENALHTKGMTLSLVGVNGDKYWKFDPITWDQEQKCYTTTVTLEPGKYLEVYSGQYGEHALVSDHEDTVLSLKLSYQDGNQDGNGKWISNGDKFYLFVKCNAPSKPTIEDLDRLFTNNTKVNISCEKNKHADKWYPVKDNSVDRLGYLFIGPVEVDDNNHYTAKISLNDAFFINLYNQEEGGDYSLVSKTYITLSYDGEKWVFNDESKLDFDVVVTCPDNDNPGGGEDPGTNPGGGDNGNNGGNNNGGSTGGGSSVSRRDDDDDWEPLPNNNYRVTKKNDKPSQNTQIVVRDPADNSDNTSSNTGSDSGKHNPETGDTTTAFAAMALAAVSLGGVVLLGRKKK